MSAEARRPGSQRRIVIIDNYDSYVYNLYQRIGELTGTAATVFRNDKATLADVRACEPTHIVISPGPGNPEVPTYFGICEEVIRELGTKRPLLGVCLGHQGIGHVFGARVVRANRVMHGKVSAVYHQGTGVLHGLPSPFTAMRYHSLVLDPRSIPSELAVTAWTADGVIMAISHRRYPIFGVQFHPESIGTEVGHQVLFNFLERRTDAPAVDIEPEYPAAVFGAVPDRT